MNIEDENKKGGALKRAGFDWWLVLLVLLQMLIIVELIWLCCWTLWGQ
jgi:hypothetical protein